VAARTASAFNPNVHIVPIHGNIKDTQFDLLWFQGFDVVLNALDNLGMLHIVIALAAKAYTTALSDARRHVNKMCMAGKIPLVESGTAGYLGQVQPLLKVCTVWMQFGTSMIQSPVGRIVQNASIASLNRHPKPIRYAPFDLRQHNQYTASFGRKAT
jgi:tRNA A37 threonylcarbamoyladenosine dehydratase